MSAKVVILLFGLIAVSVARSASSSGSVTRDENDRIVEDQNKNAKDNLAFAFDDGIMDSSQVRTESRNGLKMVGSYSDVYVKHNVKRETDQNGYRVRSSSEEEPNGTGPQIDLVNGKGDIHGQVEEA